MRPRSHLNILNTFDPKIVGHTQLTFPTELIQIGYRGYCKEIA